MKENYKDFGKNLEKIYLEKANFVYNERVDNFANVMAHNGILSNVVRNGNIISATWDNADPEQNIKVFLYGGSVKNKIGKLVAVRGV